MKNATTADPRRDTYRNRPSLAEANPDQAAQWDHERNTLTPWQVTVGSKKDAWWKCPDHPHSFMSSVQAKLRGNRCGVCANTQLLTGFNDLATTWPELVPQFAADLNGCEAHEVPGRQSVRVWWWRCELGHETQAAVATKTRSGCGVCANKILLTGYNDLATIQPAIAQQFAEDLNGLAATEVLGGQSGGMWWWRCDRGHATQSTVANRTQSGCGVCANKILLTGYNDLTTTHPKAAARFAEDLNGVPASKVMGGGSSKVWWWRCDLGHLTRNPTYLLTGEYEDICGYCSNKRVLTGFNDLATTDPMLAQEFAEDLNGCKASEVLGAMSGKKWWWRCDKSHTWQALVSNRQLWGGCAQCGLVRSSKIEQAALAEYKSITGTAAGDVKLPIPWRKNTSMRVDIVFELDGKKVVVEYDGSQFHNLPKGIERDLAKTKALLDHGYDVIRIREHPLPDLELDHPRLHHVGFKYRTVADTDLRELIRPTVEQSILSII